LLPQCAQQQQQQQQTNANNRPSVVHLDSDLTVVVKSENRMVNDHHQIDDFESDSFDSDDDVSDSDVDSDEEEEDDDDSCSSSPSSMTTTSSCSTPTKANGAIGQTKTGKKVLFGLKTIYL
jgi:hypothetical protein